MPVQFVKMEGLGNDYVYVDGFKEQVAAPERLARAISDRHFGVGGDGLILILPPQSPEADVRMRMFNADGSEAQMCGNGIRCVAKYAADHGLLPRDRSDIRVETAAGVKEIGLTRDHSGKVVAARVDMGVPRFRRRDLPMEGPPDEAVTNLPLVIAGQEYRLTGVSMGNPHGVVFLPEVASLRLEELGPQFEQHSLFPERVNTEFCRVIDRATLEMRVWERGSGETLACGTGACAAAVAACVNGFTDRKVTVLLRGGALLVEWGNDDHVYMTGPAVEVFSGEWPWGAEAPHAGAW
ncbi:MAG: diaminopimelate epimerase [Chitinophagales bacterium]